MSEIKIDKFYMREAKELVDMLFDKDFLNKELTRESIDWLEDYIGYLFQCKNESAVKCAMLTARLKKHQRS